MWLRRAFYYLQPAAILLVPGWIVAARALATVDLGAQDIIVFLAWPLLAFAMIVVLGLTWARRSVRVSRALSWTDVAALTAWYATGVAYGAFIAAGSRTGSGLLGGLLLLVSIGVVGLAVWQLLQAARRRVQTVLAGLDRSAIPAGPYRAIEHPPTGHRATEGRTAASSGSDAAGTRSSDGDVIRIDAPARPRAPRSQPPR